MEVVVKDRIQAENYRRMRELASTGAAALHREQSHGGEFASCQEPDCFLARRPDVLPRLAVLEDAFDGALLPVLQSADPDGV